MPYSSCIPDELIGMGYVLYQIVACWAGVDPGGGGGGVLGVRTPPPPTYWGTHKLHKEGKNVVRVCANTPRFSA